MGESPRSRGLRRNFCRVFSIIPFEAFTMGSSCVLDVEDVQLDHLARHAEDLRRARLRPALAPGPNLLPVRPRLGGPGGARGRPVEANHVDCRNGPFADPIRAAMGYPGRRALGDRSAHQRGNPSFNLSIRHGLRESDEDAIDLRSAVLFDCYDIRPRGRAKVTDLDKPGAVHGFLNDSKIDRAALGFLDLHDEWSAPPEHEGVDVLTPHAVKGVSGPRGLGHHRRGDHLLDACFVHLPLAAAVFAPFSATPATGPAGLSNPPRALAVSSADEERVHLHVDDAECGVHNCDELGPDKVRLLPKSLRESLPNFPVQLGLDGFCVGSSELPPEGLLAGRDLGVDSRANEKRGEFPPRESTFDEIDEFAHLVDKPAAHPARLAAREAGPIAEPPAAPPGW